MYKKNIAFSHDKAGVPFLVSAQLKPQSTQEKKRRGKKKEKKTMKTGLSSARGTSPFLQIDKI